MSNESGLKIAIVDFGMGNLFSIQRACELVGLNSEITHDKSMIEAADGIILPGVGAFGKAVHQLKEYGLIETIRKCVEQGKPFFGICLGMQLLMSQSEEFGVHQGLDIIQGSVVRFPEKDKKGDTVKVPQVCWNQIYSPAGKERTFDEHSYLNGLTPGEYMYFVHSFYVKPDDGKNVACYTDYAGIQYCSAIQYKNIFATQFHPEKSGEKGLRIYKNWSESILCSTC